MLESTKSIYLKELIELLLLTLSIGVDVFFVGASLGSRTLKPSKIKRFILYVGAFHCLFAIVGISLGASLHRLIGSFSELTGGIVLLVTGGYLLASSIYQHRYGGFEVTPNMLTLAMGVSLECLFIGMGVAMHLHFFFLSILLFTGMALMSATAGTQLGRKIGVRFGLASEIAGALCLVLIGALFLYW